jgi:hypothetical protein
VLTRTTCHHNKEKDFAGKNAQLPLLRGGFWMPSLSLTSLIFPEAVFVFKPNFSKTSLEDG